MCDPVFSEPKKLPKTPNMLPKMLHSAQPIARRSTPTLAHLPRGSMVTPPRGRPDGVVRNIDLCNEWVSFGPLLPCFLLLYGTFGTHCWLWVSFGPHLQRNRAENGLLAPISEDGCQPGHLADKTVGKTDQTAPIRCGCRYSVRLTSGDMRRSDFRTIPSR